MARRILNEQKWHPDKTLDNIEVTYIHRGAPGDRLTVAGPDIIALEPSFFVIVRNDVETRIPYHRVIDIRESGSIIWSRKTV